ncbi:MAG: EboA domain-containing protein [Bacteroidota bacterium]
MLLPGVNEFRVLDRLFFDVLQKNISPDAIAWLTVKADLVRNEEKSTQLNLAFSHLPKQTGKAAVEITPAETLEISALLPGFSIEGWSADRLARVWLLMQVRETDKELYLKKISGLFDASEMNEQVALYSALPFYTNPENWIARCETGIRSNIGTVLESIMYYNPYPAAYLSENSWNQLVLKAFFTEKDVTKITGLENRVNTALIDTLNDYVAERTAAHRTVEPNIYKLIELRNQTI